MANRKPQLGDQVKDSVTGFKGVVTAIAEYLTGCKQFLVQPPVEKKSAHYVDGRWIDEDRLAVTKASAVSISVERNGPDIPAPLK